MERVLVAGIGTEVGKTVVSAILTTLLNGDYWKPIQCGEEEYSDTEMIKKWIDISAHFVHPPVYSLKTPVSPHHAARLEKILIKFDAFILPKTTRPLIIEGVGGIFVPLTSQELSIDLFKLWDCKWVIVSKHYLGSINHTLLTVEILKQLHIPILGIIFNGEHNPDSEKAILDFTHLPLLGRLLPESNINFQTIQRYAKQWRPQFSKLLP
ncbi:MAG: dethiobiotin synthase [Parachlamydiaceae bacterium]|nr:dethiobiotin synthase [Parachlamydiaceae bacterium]